MKHILKIVNIVLALACLVVGILILNKSKNKCEKYVKVGFDVYTDGGSGSWGQPYGDSQVGTGSVEDCNSKVGNSAYYCDAPVCQSGNVCDPTVDGDICPPGSASAIVADDPNNPGVLGSCSNPLKNISIPVSGSSTLGSLCCMNENCIQNLPIATNNCGMDPDPKQSGCLNKDNLPLPDGVGICTK